MLDIFLHFSHIHIAEHIFPHEIGDAIHLFHGHGLLEKVQRVVLGDTEERFEFHGVGIVIIVHIHVERLLQPLLEVQDVAAKVSEIFFDGQRSFAHHKEAGGLVAAGREVEDLCQRHVGVIFRIRKDRQDDGVFIFIAKCHRLLFAGRVAALCIVAPHIGIERAFLTARVGRFVVIDLRLRD